MDDRVVGLLRRFWSCYSPECTAEVLIEEGLAPVSDSVLYPGLPVPVGVDRGVLADRLVAMLVGTAVGDALGSTLEGRPLGGKYRKVLVDVPPGSRITDDTQLSFWGVEVFLARGWLDPALLAERYSRERIIGIGGTVKRFLRNYKDSGLPWFLSGVPSAGNGAVMRLPPVLASSIVALAPRIGPESVVYTAPIYRDPLALASAFALSATLWALANGAVSLGDPDGVVNYYLELHSAVELPGSRYTLKSKHKTFTGQGWEVIEAVLRDADKRGLDPVGFTKTYGSWAYIVETVGFILHLLRTMGPEASPLDLLSCAARCSEDSDTIAAIVGAIIGAAYGMDGIPEGPKAVVYNRLLPRRFLADLQTLEKILKIP